MPQLVKGGKYVFAWSRVSELGKVVVPPEAVEEYGLENTEKVVLMPGSKRSGGFGLTTVRLLKGTPVGTNVEKEPRLARFEAPEGEPVRIGSKTYCWVGMGKNGIFSVPLKTLRLYGVEPGGKLLVVRGSGRAVGFIVRGPIIEEAERHPEIELFV
jgi:hypothetical protein